MSQLSQSSAALARERGRRRRRRRPDDDERRRWPSRPTSDLEPSSREGRAGSRVPRRARACRMRSRLPPRSVAGQPTPATVTAAAPSGRRAATSSAAASVNPKIAHRTSECISGFRSGLERQEDVVEVDDPRADVAQHRREHALVAERERAPTAARRTRPRRRRATLGASASEPRSAASDERGQRSRARRSRRASPIEPRILEAEPGAAITASAGERPTRRAS